MNILPYFNQPLIWSSFNYYFLWSFSLACSNADSSEAIFADPAELSWRCEVCWCGSIWTCWGLWVMISPAYFW